MHRWVKAVQTKEMSPPAKGATRGVCVGKSPETISIALHWVSLTRSGFVCLSHVTLARDTDRLRWVLPPEVPPHLVQCCDLSSSFLLLFFFFFTSLGRVLQRRESPSRGGKRGCRRKSPKQITCSDHQDPPILRGIDWIWINLIYFPAPASFSPIS